MPQIARRTIFSSLFFTLMLVLTACGGGGGESIEPIQWPQPVAFTDFTGGQTKVSVETSIYAKSPCQTCISLYGVARSSSELGKLILSKTDPNWPAPYNDKLYSELPIDYSSKVAVVLEDLGSGLRYQYAVQKVEESAEAVTITMLKCMVFDVYQDGYSIRFGLLLPKTTKPIQVKLVQSGKPTLPVYEPNGLGAC